MEMQVTATVVSIVPLEINADKPTIYPGVFRIPKADDNDPSVLHVVEASHFVYMGSERGKNPFLRVRNSAFEVARAIVEDYISGLIATSAEAHPGLFWVPGLIEKEAVEIECAEPLAKARAAQRLWYKNLVAMAEGDWAKSNHSHKAITNIEIIAANKLGLHREWCELPKEEAISTVECPICRVRIDDKCIVCPSCKVIRKPVEFKKYEFANV